MAFDFGTRRTGIAVTDPLKIIAQGLCGLDTGKIWEFLAEYLKSEEVEAFVVGWPEDKFGKPTDSTPHVAKFIRQLQGRYPKIPVYKVDEYNSSRMAVESLIQSGVKKKQRRDKKLVDEVSATIILQQFLSNSSDS
jgi:putative Holliday junction resolvase